MPERPASGRTADHVVVVRQLTRFPATRRHDEHVEPDAVSALVGDPFPIGRPARGKVVSHWRKLRDDLDARRVPGSVDQLDSAFAQSEERQAAIALIDVAAAAETVGDAVRRAAERRDFPQRCLASRRAPPARNTGSNSNRATSGAADDRPCRG